VKASQIEQMFRSISKLCLRWIALWFALLMFWPATLTFSQVSTASVTGIVEDSTGARISGAAIKLINDLTGAENDTKTGREGIFLAPGVIPGAYTLQIARDGFATAEITGLILNVGETKSLLIRLQVGSVTQTVKIDASGLTPTTDSAAVSTVVDRAFVANIPLNGRSFQDLISMTPGVSTQTPQAFGAGYNSQGDFSVNGQQPDTNSYTIDGVSADIGVGLLGGHTKFASSGNAAGTTALGTTQSLVSIDGLQEFRVLTSNYSAEYGRTSGGQFTLLTRSGTNTFHGSLYDYVRNYTDDAVDWFTHFNTTSPPAPYWQNDAGGSIGGPFSLAKIDNGRDKTFFFLSYEELRVTEPSAPLVEYVPVFSLQTFNTIPAALQQVLEYFPTRQGGGEAPPSSTGLGLYVPQDLSEPGTVKSANIRFDQSVSDKVSAFFRYSTTPSQSDNTVLSSASRNNIETQTFTLGLTAHPSSSNTNELRIGYGLSTSILNTALDGFLTSNLYQQSTNESPNLNAALGIPAIVPLAASDVFIHSAGAGDSEINTDEAFGSIHQWDLRDTFAIQSGHHFLQFGIDQRHLVSTIHRPALSVEADFFNPQSLIANSASDIAITKNLPASPVFNQFAAYVQDEWQASKALTISSGLRWEVDPAPNGRNGSDAFTAIGNPTSRASLSLAPRGTALWDTTWVNLAPRIGAAWLIDRRTGHELVMRAGGGIFFDTDNRAAVRAFSALGFSETMHPVDVPVPITPAQLDFSLSSSAPYTNSLVFDFPRHLQLPYSVQWNVAIEKSLGRNQTFTASYVGASGDRLLREQRTDVNSQNPEFGEIESFPNGVTSNYQALQLKFQRSIAHGVQALGSYTWSHTIDYGSIDPDWPLTRADSNFDLRHNLQAALSWDERELSGRWLRTYILGGWGADARITARSAFPVTPLGNLFSDPATGNRYFSGVDLIPGQRLYIYGAQYPGGRILNGGPDTASPAFVLPAVGVAGDAPRNMLRGFGDNQINVAIRKEIHLYDNFNLQFRTEAYNLLNHPDLGYIDPSLTDQLFGQATLMLNQSFGPSGSLYEPGGPRALQFSLRLHF
jgi:hypothetical protein